MKNAKIERIEEAEGEIDRLEDEERTTRQEALEDDGVIDAEEQADLDRIGGKIVQLRDVVQRLRAEVEENKRIWESHAGEWSELQAKSTEMNESGFFDAGAVATSVEDIQGAVGDQRWADATSTLENATYNLDPIYQQFCDQRDAKAQYEPRLSETRPRLDGMNETTEENAYLSDLHADVITYKSEMEAAEAEHDYVTALAKLEEIERVLQAIDQAIEAKKAEYEGARATLDQRMSSVTDTTYFDLVGDRDALSAKITEIDAAAAEENWSTALQLVEATNTELDAFADKITEQERIRAQIETNFGPAKTELATYSDITSPVRTNAEAAVAEIEAALAGNGSLKDAEKKVNLLARQLTELAALKSVNDRLDGVDPDDLDDVSRQIVEEMKAAGTLNTLPTETRSTLLDNLQGGTVTADEHDAIQEIFSMPHVDRQFNEVDSETRQSIINAYMEDPEIQEMSENWGEMDSDERLAAVRRLIEVPCGDEGWDVGMPANIVEETDPDNLGAYNHSTDTMSFDPDAPSHENFAEVLDTITHEMGHRYQMELIARLDGPVGDKAQLQPGDDEYEQARWLQQDDNYFNNHHSEFDNIYWTSPSETHSRVMGAEMQAGLNEGFRVPEGGESVDDGSGGGGGHDHDAHGHGHDDGHEHNHPKRERR